MQALAPDLRRLTVTPTCDPLTRFAESHRKAYTYGMSDVSLRPVVPNRPNDRVAPSLPERLR